MIMETTQNNPSVYGTEIKEELSNFLNKNIEYETLDTHGQKIYESGFWQGIEFYQNYLENSHTNGSVEI